jgi:hypothetical protein
VNSMVESTLAASISRPSDGPVLLVHEPYLTFYSIEIQPTLVSSQYDQPSESPPPQILTGIKTNFSTSRFFDLPTVLRFRCMNPL